MKQPINDLDAEYLRSVLDYDPKTGLFTWKWRDDVCKQTAHRDVGRVAGADWGDGRIQIKVRGRAYFAHRLAWLHYYGEWPQEIIDHIDGNPANNSLVNLRSGSQALNTKNRRVQRNNKSGVIGVYYNRRMDRWGAKIDKSHLGYFRTIEEAVAARKKAESERYPEWRRAS